MNRVKLLLILSILPLVLLGIIAHNSHAAMPATRALDPVIVTGAELANFIGRPITSVVLYRYDGSWEAIPFQIDEKAIEADDTTADFVRFEDGLIDADDELVFMAADAGAAERSWPAGTTGVRAKLALRDPLSTIDGTVYLFESQRLPRSAVSYVSLDLATETVTAISYTLGLDSDTVIGLDSLRLNGESADLIDRQKVSVNAGLPPFVMTQNEEQLVSQLMLSPFTSIVTGPVRLVEGGDFGTAYYGGRFDLSFNIDIDAINDMLPLGSVQSVRISLDQNDPATTGVASYADSNGVTTAIDGVADVNETAALRDWYQVNGGALGGFVVTIPELSIGRGKIESYYADLLATSSDTGDMQQFADTGVRVDSPGGWLSYQQVSYVLPPNTANVVGADYFRQATMPLAVSVSIETQPDEDNSTKTYLPHVVTE